MNHHDLLIMQPSQILNDQSERFAYILQKFIVKSQKNLKTYFLKNNYVSWLQFFLLYDIDKKIKKMEQFYPHPTKMIHL